jgi:hypothetical protein
MTKHYWMICGHEMLNYCGISKGLARRTNQSCYRVSYGHHRQFLDSSHGGFMGKSSFLE